MMYITELLSYIHTNRFLVSFYSSSLSSCLRDYKNMSPDSKTDLRKPSLHPQNLFRKKSSHKPKSQSQSRPGRGGSPHCYICGEEVSCQFSRARSSQLLDLPNENFSKGSFRFSILNFLRVCELFSIYALLSL